MSADGELYIGETCYDCFYDELTKVFGKNKWRLDQGKFSDAWNMNEFPLKVNVNVLDIETEKLIGVATITSEAVVEDDGYSRYIVLHPISIQIVSKKKEEIKNA